MVIYRNMKRQVDEQNNQLIEADKQKTQFYQYTSHELKSPIIAIKTTIDGLAKSYKTQLDDKAIKLMGRASNRCTQMLDIIKELLIITQSRSYSNPKENEKIYINEIIDNTIETEKNTAKVSGIKVELNLSPENPVLFAKKKDIIKIIDNLVSNAIRYNKENGEIKITTEKINNKLLIKIKDTGIGIPVNDLSNIFAEFYRTENAKKYVNFGTGLGLSIVKQIVDNYKGNIDISSDVSKGTKFSVYIPHFTYHDTGEE